MGPRNILSYNTDAMAATIISVEQYLHTSYQDGDREYVDGRIVRRNVGEVDHSDVQTLLAVYLRAQYPAAWTGVEVRVQVSPTRFRIPDVTVVLGSKPAEQIISTPPALVIEVLSPDDRAADVQEKIEDYLRFGIPCCWVINPRTRRAYIHDGQGGREATDGRLTTAHGEIEMPLAKLFDSTL